MLVKHWNVYISGLVQYNKCNEYTTLLHWASSLRTCEIRYRKTSDIRCTLVGYVIVDQSDVVGASPVGAAPATSSLLT